MARAARDAPLGTTLALIGSAALIVAALLPWSTAHAGAANSGLDLVDGFVTFGVGVAVGLLALTTLRPGAAWVWRGRLLAGLGGLLTVALAIKWYRGLLLETPLSPRYGLHVTLLGGLVLLAAAVVGLRDER